MKLKPIENENGLKKDIVSGAIINVNREEIQSAKLRKKKFAEQKARLDKIENDIADIKKLILELMETKSDGN